MRLRFVWNGQNHLFEYAIVHPYSRVNTYLGKETIS
jgi:hypothetical protein